jgi:beta-phosphoglucomutase-like phosphatase (HAD superfamily)
MAFQGAIFDVAGVLVDSPYELAWRESLQRLIEQGRFLTHALERRP